MAWTPPIPEPVWKTASPEVQAAILALAELYEQRLAKLEARVNDLDNRLKLNSTNSSKPPSSDPIGMKRKPPAPPSGRTRGGQPWSLIFSAAVITSTRLLPSAGVTQLTVDGGDGNDTLRGGQGSDALLGGDGNDFIDGGAGNDMVRMGAGDDTFRWDPGDGSDSVDGEDGHDTMRFDGSNAAELIDVSANGQDVRLSRNVGNVTMDLSAVETLNLNAMGGGDTIAVSDLNGTALTQLNLALAGAPGTSTAAGQGTTVIVNGTNNADQISVAGSAAGIAISGLAASVDITGSDAATDQLSINGLAGDDTIDAGDLQAGAIALFLSGGDGDDDIHGSQDSDLVTGGPGNDQVDLGAGDDTFVWSPGDGSDVIDGGAGHDSMIFNGSNTSELIEVAGDAQGVRLTRSIGNILMNLNGVEEIDVNARGGDDTITVNNLSGSDLGQLNLDLSAGDTPGTGDGLADNIVVNGTDGSDAVTVAGDASGISVLGLPAQVNIKGTDPAFDQLTINTRDGDDALDASGLSDGATLFAANGGAGDDLLIGSDGDDTLSGDDGNDTLNGGAGDDVLMGGPGVDVLNGGPGDNTLIQD